MSTSSQASVSDYFESKKSSSNKPSNALKIVSRGLFWVVILLIAFYMLFPFLWAINSSLKTEDERIQTPATYFPRNLTLENFAAVMGISEPDSAGPRLGGSLVVALLVSLVVTIALAVYRYVNGRRNELPNQPFKFTRHHVVQSIEFLAIAFVVMAVIFFVIGVGDPNPKNEISPFGRGLINSAVVALTVVLLALMIGSFAAYALGRLQFLGKRFILYVILAMTLFPQISILAGLFAVVKELNMYGSLSSMMFSYLIFTLPFTAWVLTSFFRTLPAELEQAALVDGASPFQTFYMILLPLTAPALVTTGLLAFISAWNEYLFALTFTLATPKVHTVTVEISNFSGIVARQEPFGEILAASIIVTIPLIILVLVFQRRIVQGLTAGAVKG